MFKLFSKFACAAAVAVTGCKDLDTVQVAGLSEDARSNSTTWVVTVGMENSEFAGSCPGCGLDAARMTSLFRQYTPNVKTFVSDMATKDRVKAALEEAVANGELVIFYYSGHGGQQRFWNTGSEETDGQDEFFCFYDTYMLDNEMWTIIGKCKGRFLLIADACHSETIYRQPKPITLLRNAPLSVTHNMQGSVNLLVWSGCPEGTYSYGSSTGGKMTNTLLRYFDSRKTYDYIWNEMENDSALKQFEVIQRTVIGNGFAAKPVFQ